MSKRRALLMTCALAIGMLNIVLRFPKVEATGTIYIRADGSIDPPTTPISTLDNVTYTFTDNIDDSIVIERSNIVIDGRTFTVQGDETSDGFRLDNISNVTIKNVQVRRFEDGIQLINSSNNNITGNNITANTYAGIRIGNSRNNNIAGNHISDTKIYGVLIEASSCDNNVTRNDVTINYKGIILTNSWNNNVNGNNVIGNTKEGIYLHMSPNNTLTQNLMSENGYNFGVSGFFLNDFMNSIDASNLVNGKPVYYLKNQTNVIINRESHPEVGYLQLIQCVNVTIEGLHILNNYFGLSLAYSNGSKILANNVSGNLHGIFLTKSSNNTILCNAITMNFNGIRLFYSSNNNRISGNDIISNERGINFWQSSSNRIYRNNFIKNTLQVRTTIPYYSNIWIDNFEGNYWSNYTGLDVNCDGIGDSYHVIDGNNTDHYPLMGMFLSFNTTLGYDVSVISNSTIEDFQYFEYNNTILMHVSNMTSNQTFGFIRICIPHALMNDTYQVKIDGVEPYYINYTLYDNETHRWIYFSYQHSTLEIIITPEVPSFLILPLFMITTLLAVEFYKRRHTLKRLQ